MGKVKSPMSSADKFKYIFQEVVPFPGKITKSWEMLPVSRGGLDLQSLSEMQSSQQKRNGNSEGASCLYLPLQNHWCKTRNFIWSWPLENACS